MPTIRCINGRWVPAIPLKAPIVIRWLCEHEWTPHVYPQGWDAWNYFGCKRCGVHVEAEVQPPNGAWPRRRLIARAWWCILYGNGSIKH